MPDPDAADRAALRPRPRTVTLSGGEQVPVEFTLESLWVIEEVYGSLGAYQTALRELLDGDEAGVPNRQVFIPLIKALACIMPTEELQHPRTLARRLSLDSFTDAAQTLMEAFAEAVVEPPDDTADGHPNSPPPERPPAMADGSRGGGFTTPALSSSAAPTTPSGG